MPSREQLNATGAGQVVAEIRRIHARSHGTYGGPRVHAELRRRGWAANHKRVERLMRAHGIVGYRPRRRRSLTKQEPPRRPPRTCRGGCSTPSGRTWPGAATSPTSPPTKAGCTWLRSSTWPRATLLGYSMGWRGLTMTPKALRLLQHLRRQLLHPPTPRKRSTNLSQPLRIITQEPAPDPFTPLLERHRETYSLPWG